MIRQALLLSRLMINNYIANDRLYRKCCNFVRAQRDILEYGYEKLKIMPESSGPRHTTEPLLSSWQKLSVPFQSHG